MLRIRSIIAFLFIALALCVIGMRGARSQSASARRITNTKEEALNLNPSLSGDGRRIAFESTEDLARVGGFGGFRALRANLSSTTVSFNQMGMTRAVAPAISQDGSRIAFASKDNPLGTNSDGNSEIYFYDGTLRQVTNTSPGDVTLRLRNGNFQPSITDDGRYIAFSSNRTLAGLNGDNNLDIFIYDTTARTFTQLTNTAGTIGATDAKISGDGTRVAYIRDSGTIEGSSPRDLVLQERAGGAPQVIADNVINLSMTYGRAISDNGLRVVYSAPAASSVTARQVFLYDGQSNTTRQITSLGEPEEDGDVPLHPTISGDGSRLAFATRRNVIGGNSDDSVELYTFHVLTGQTARLTSAPSSARAAVVSSLSDDGSLVAFNFPRVLSGDVSSSANATNSEIYTIAVTTGTPGSAFTVLNGASFGHEPATDEAVAPDSVAVAIGASLGNVTAVAVNNRPAQIINTSPGLVTFHVPAATELGTAQVVITNSDGVRTRGTVTVLAAAPGVFTRSGDGTGEGVVVDAATGQFGPFDPTGGMKRLIVSATGVRYASEVSVTIGGRMVTVEAINRSMTMPGRDEITILLPSDLSGAGVVDLVVRANDRASNPVKVEISGRARRDIIVNEVLADPPLEAPGDANHDGVRDSGDDEFVELVNATTCDIDISGFELLTRSESASGDTLRHVFAPGTIFPAGTAIVIFGGGAPPVNNPVFGGAQVFTASKDRLSLSNSGGFVTLREPSGAIVTVFSYGDANGLNADKDQSLTRSPDISGPFVLHKSAQNSGGRAYSPGTRVDGTPFAPSPAIARIQITPASANIGTGARLQFTARAYASNGQELTCVIFNWTSSAPAVASIDQNGLATARSPGSTQIRASARGVQSNSATLTVFFEAQVLTRIEVTPASVSIPPGGQQQFTARAIDQHDNEIAGVNFAWSSSNEAVATVDQSGMATAHSLGTATISASAQGKTGSATLNVVAPVIVINEVLADPPGGDADDLEGDANHDGVRDSGDDEFVELVNTTNAQLNISGWTVSTRSLSEPTERTRHTFAEGTTLPSRSATVIFGGGAFDPNNPLFACAQVFKASTGRLSLTNTGLHVIVRDATGNLVAQLTYGSAAGLNAGSDQSLTRSPDITGNFVRHTEAAGAEGRRFSPGTKVNGTPLGPCQGRLTSVTISPTSASVIINQTIQFTAQAIDQFGQPMTGINITFTSSNTSVATIESVSTNPNTGVATAVVRGRRLGTAQITATATDGTTTVTSSPATLKVIPVPPRVTRIEVTPESATINRGQTQQFTAKAFNQSTPVSGATFTWTSSNEVVATVDENGLATGVGIGTVTITATAPDGQGGTVSDTATLNVQVPLVINEILADVQSDDPATPVVEGDANRDGVRDSGDDEFIELVNNTNSPVDISGVYISDAINKRFTFPANTVLEAGRAVVVFGGGEPPAGDPNFGGALIFKASSLGFNDTGDTVTVKLPVAGMDDVTIVALTYGSGGSAPAPSDKSLTRSPDAEAGTTGGDFVAHPSAEDAAGRIFSPGTRTDGTPFGSPPITRIQITPSSATINIGQTQTFTARAFSGSGSSEVEVQNVSFIWDSSDPSRATVSPTIGTSTTATAHSGGTVTIRPRAGGQQGTATLNINFPPVARVEVMPATAKIPVGGTQQFTAKAFDANNQEIVGITFTWTSSNESVATVDQNGLATGVSVGMTTITASADGKSDTATLNVVARTVTINEVLADPPDDLAGDANRDGVRDTSDDEFVELVNALTTNVNISGWTIRTRSESATSETTRHTFAANTTLAAGKAIVVFGGGSPPVGDPAFGGSQVVKASTGRLSLTNTGLTVIVRDEAGNLVTQLTYGSSSGLNGGSGQSLTRSPDITGGFTKHSTADNAAGRLYSPGTRTDGTPFGSPPITRIQITPASATIDVGETKTFTARAYSGTGSNEVEVQNVSFIWDSSDPSKATVSPKTGRTTTATAHQGGTVTIRARAGGQQGTATLKINFPPVARVEVMPATAKIPVGGTQQFTAKAFDANNQEIVGITFTWTSSNESVATIDQNGLATGVSVGTTTITASADGKSDTATLNVVARTVTINEVLADPPDGLAGDANHDGVRDTSDDEFVELVNALTTNVNISGWTIRTRSESATSETTRHTFAANTTLAAGKAIVVFGGGNFDPANPNFGGSQVVKASTGRLSLTNTGLTVIVRDEAGNLVTQLTYGSSSGLNGGSGQSLTRSPDITGGFTKHTAANNSDGRLFSPGTRTDGTPFGSPPITRIQITPSSATVNIGQTQTFTARAFSGSGSSEVEVQNVSFIWDSSDPSRATVSPATGTSTTATAHQGGTVTIRARAGGQQGTATLNINFPPISRIVVTPATAKIPVGGTQQFTAKAFDANNQEIVGVSFTWTSSNESVATVDQNGLATGVSVGMTTITASAGGKSDSSTLTVVTRTVVINEVLADPPDDLAGDANRDGVRDTSDDEFVELINALTTNVNISGWTIRTRSESATSETTRHTFAANTTLAAGKVIVVFGGGSPPVGDPAFGGSQVVTASTGRLSLTNTGLTVIVRDEAGNLVAQLTYGGSTGLNADANRSLTRSPDITGAFTQHTAANNADGRLFSPGTRTDGTPFGSPPITRIEVTPSSATINTGQTQTFTARAYSGTGSNEVEVQNVSFIWDSSDPSKATVSPKTGRSTVATGVSGGTVTIRARAGGQQGTATLNINFPPVARIEVMPASATITIGGTQQFTAKAFDANNQEITGVTFTWTSSNESVATIDQNGLAISHNLGMTTITASAQGKSDTATLKVVGPTVVINEVLADPPDGLAGDANHDGVRDSGDDEFIELANSKNAAINISGWNIYTRSTTGTTENLRHTFAANTTLPAGDAIVVFGGGNFDPQDPVFGGAQVVAASTGGLSLTNSGLTIILRKASGEFVAQFTYGGSTGLNGDANQSLTRSPDITGDFVLHTQAAGANGRRFSPGRKADGSLFVPRSGNLTSVDISPDSASVVEGQTTQFTAQAFDQYGQPMTGINITFESSNTNVATIESVMTNPNTGVATATVRGQNQGMAQITATASDGTTTVMSDPATLTVTEAPPQVDHVEVSPSTATINRGQTQQFTATAFDASNQPVSGVTFTWTSSNEAVATVDQNGLATGVGIGTTTITATAPDGQGGTVSDDATLNVQVPLVINELLADPPDGAEGDANRDGTRDGTQDEFVELVNNSDSPVDISGVIIADATSNRFTFPANTTLAAGQAAIVFGGGSPPVNDPNFGGALVFKTGSGGLSLNNTGDTVTVKLPVGGTDVVIDTVTYGAEGNANQSLTRSPDITGAFTQHSTAPGSDGRLFSPGTRVDGTPFGSPPVMCIEVTPSSAAIDIGETQTFTARAFSDSGCTAEIQNVSFFWKSSDTTKATVSPKTGQSTTATAHADGTVTISAHAGGQQGTAQLTINPPPPTLSINDVSLNEGDGGATTFTFTVHLSSPAQAGGVKFDIATADGTAQDDIPTSEDDDYEPKSLSNQTIPEGDQDYTFNVTVNGDMTNEPDETFFVNVTNVMGATVGDGQGQGTILNDDSPQLSINDVTMNEGDAGATVFTFTVHSSRPAPAGGITFDISTADGTAHDDNPASEDDDYEPKSLTNQTIPEGDQDYTFQVTVNGDTFVEPDETFTVNLSNVMNAGVSDGQGIGTITNDDVAVVVISQIYGGGGNSGATYTHDFIEIFNRGTTTVDLAGWSVQYNSATGTGNWSVTPLCPTGPCLLAPGQYFLVQEAAGAGGTTPLPDPDATGTIPMTAGTGKVALVNKTMALTGACPSADASILDLVGYGSNASTANFCFEGAGPAPAPSNTTADLRKGGGCVDTDNNQADFFVHAPVPRNTDSPLNTCNAGQTTDIFISDVTVTEGNSGTVPATFTVSLSAPSNSTVTVDYATADGTAHAPADYTAIPTTQLVFNPGDTSKTVTVQVKGDIVDEANETFFVNLTNASNAVILDNQGVGTITDDDAPAVLTVSDFSANEGDNGTTDFTFNVNLSAPAPEGGVTFDIATQDNTATDADNDYEPKSLTNQTIPEGSQTYTFTVQVNGDTVDEPNETFFVNVTNVTGATLTGGDGQGVGTILNDDSPALTINDVSMTEGNTGTKTYTFTVHLSKPAPEGGVTFDIATQDNTATADDGNASTISDDDYEPKSLSNQTIPEGQQDYQFTVTVNGDTVVEPDESFFVNVSNVVHATVTDGQGVGTILNDDTPDLVISQIYPGGGNAGATYTNDFIEIFNQGTTTIDFSVTPYSVQYAGATSAFGSTAAANKTNITTKTIAPGEYFLIQGASGGANGVALPMPDLIGSIAMAATGGKVALVLGTGALPNSSCPGDDLSTAPTNPSGNNIMDFVGYGSGGNAPNCYEGAGPAPFSTSTAGGLDPDARSIIRTSSCTDTNNNSTDFSNPPTPPVARNKSTPAVPCP